MDKRRSRMLSEFLARYNRGEIGKEQFLNQKKAILQKERAEEQAEVNKLNASIASLSIQIEDVEAQLQEMVEKETPERTRSGSYRTRNY